MRRKTEATRQRIIDAAYECFWRAGYARTSLDTIADRAGVTKRTLYSYVRSKDDLLAAVMSHHDALAAQRLKRIGDRMPIDRDGLIESFFGQLSGWASATPRWSGSGFTRLVVELADLPGHPARALARRVKGATETWLAGRLAQAQVHDPAERASEIMLLMEGAMALTLIHGHRRYIDAASRAAKRLVGVPARRPLRAG
ncbi:TetR/AcrR family transcriptional regulator [Pseudorhodoplanes sp.]|uniref:TetR/AcrR family transcriptional regulator n=1 Tax=Pseudorhodoplanes sp. TaxID=1934341 RepID=UPI003D11D554